MTRLEDPELLTGQARFMADLPFAPTTGHVAFVRSPVAHADIVALDLDDALAAPGVLAVETTATLGLPTFSLFPDTSDQNHPPLAGGRARHVGEALVMVVADSEAHALDAAELVGIEFGHRPALPTPSAAAGGVALYDGVTNLVAAIAPETTDDPVDGADIVVDASIANQRVASVPLECDGILVTPADDRLDVWCTSQGVQELRSQLAANLGIEATRLRVRSPNVGGGFGGRATATPEMVAICAAALRLGRPLRWMQSRYENLTGMAQGRGYQSRLRLGLTNDGIITGLDVEITADAGSSAHMAAYLLVSARRQVPGMYRVPAYRFSSETWLTTTTPVGAYRGAGQPEANHARERVLDIAARRLGIDPVELRRRNLARADEFPFATAGGFAYDVGDPQRALDRALDLLDWEMWRDRQAARRAEGSSTQIGLGVSIYSQTSGRGTPADAAEVRVEADGRVVVHCASPDHGQGHRTTWAALVAEQLAIDPALVSVVDADTDVLDTGQSTGGSRSTQVAASAIVNACGDVIDAARRAAAEQLEAAASDLVVVPAGFGEGAGLAVAGVPTRRITWAALASDAPNSCLAAARNEAVADAAYPYGCHATVVEVDTELGDVRLVTHVAVDDCGRVLQPALVAGQQHGGSVAGLSQALFEQIAYDDDANPLTATLASYLLPAASEVCTITTDTLGTPGRGNQLGTRGIGENGCNGATAAAHNAVIDALAPWGVEHIDLPLTPERIWRALNP